MADFNGKKLQVFVSSTFSDLKHERQAAVEAILTAGHIPAGMELFTAGDESQMDVIKHWIHESDVYLLILGARYGSIEPTTGKSYTHLEYEYALEKNKPLFACVLNDHAIKRKVADEGKDVLELKYGTKLEEFRAQVLSKMSKICGDAKDIQLEVINKLSQLVRREDLVGWVRANTQTDLPALADEIARLSKENATLRGQVFNGQQEQIINGLTFDETRLILEKRGVLEKFINSRPGRMDAFVKTDYDTLTDLGLLRWTGIGYERTDEARVFLNKWQFLQLSKGS